MGIFDQTRKNIDGVLSARKKPWLTIAPVEIVENIENGGDKIWSDVPQWVKSEPPDYARILGGTPTAERQFKKQRLL